VATQRVAPRRQGRIVRLPEHTAALQSVVLAAFTTDAPCKTKVNRPPSAAALRIAAEIGGGRVDLGPVIDLSVYQRLNDGSDGA
jgi:hypothetical protein